MSPTGIQLVRSQSSEGAEVLSDEPLPEMGLAPEQAVLAPAWPLFASALSVLLSASLLGLAFSKGADDLPLFAWGYICGAVVAVFFVIVFRNAKVGAQRSVWYSPRQRLSQAALVLITAGILLGVAHAWFLATELAKR